MRSMRHAAALLTTGFIFAAFIFAILALPGLLSDQDSTVPLSVAQVSRR